MFSEEQLQEIKAYPSLQNILLKLRKYWRWDDHLLLTTILYRLDSEACDLDLRFKIRYWAVSSAGLPRG